jgi:hypothetical protein
MKPLFHKLEVFTDKIIPYLVFILLMLIILDLFYHEKTIPYENEILILDYSIVIVFIIDLSFKYYRVRNAKIFLKMYWIDILAVFPFFLLFRVVEEILILASLRESLIESQKIIHSSVEIGRIAKELQEEERILKEIQEASRLERTSLIARIIRPLERIPRIIRMLHFYERPYKKSKKT